MEKDVMDVWAPRLLTTAIGAGVSLVVIGVVGVLADGVRSGFVPTCYIKYNTSRENTEIRKDGFARHITLYVGKDAEDANAALAFYLTQPVCGGKEKE